MNLIGLRIFAAGLCFLAAVRGQVALETEDASLFKQAVLPESPDEFRKDSEPTPVSPEQSYLLRSPNGLRAPLDIMENPSSSDMSLLGGAEQSLRDQSAEVSDDMRSYYSGRPTQAPPVPPYIVTPPFGFRSVSNIHHHGLPRPTTPSYIGFTAQDECRICDGYIECGKSNSYTSCTNAYPCTENEYKMCEKLIQIDNSTACDRPGIFADPTSTQKYFSCDIVIKDNNFEIVKKEHQCDKFKSYDSTTLRCIYDYEKFTVPSAIPLVDRHPNKTDIKCRRPGVLPYPGDCKLYFKCHSAGSEPAFFSCPKFQYFNGYSCSSYRSPKCTMELIAISLKEKMEADLIYYWMKMILISGGKPTPLLTPTPHLPYSGDHLYICPYEFYSARDPLSKHCDKYYICLKTNVNGTFVLRPVIRSCKPGMFFSNELHICVHSKPAGCI